MDAPQNDRRLVTIVAALPTPQHYRVRDESNAAAVVVLDDRGEDSRRVDGIPPHGFRLRLD